MSPSLHPAPSVSLSHSLCVSPPLSPCVSLFLLLVSTCSCLHLSLPLRGLLLQDLRLSGPWVCIKLFILSRPGCLNSPSRPQNDAWWGGLRDPQNGFWLSAPGEKNPPPPWAPHSCQPLLMTDEETEALGEVSVRMSGSVCVSLCLPVCGCVALCVHVCVCCHTNLHNDIRSLTQQLIQLHKGILK